MPVRPRQHNHRKTTHKETDKIRHRHGLQRKPRISGDDEGVQGDKGITEEACLRGGHIKVVLTTHILKRADCRDNYSM